MLLFSIILLLLSSSLFIYIYSSVHFSKRNEIKIRDLLFFLFHIHRIGVHASYPFDGFLVIRGKEEEIRKYINRDTRSLYCTCISVRKCLKSGIVVAL